MTPGDSRRRVRNGLHAALVMLVLVYGTFLQFDALVGMYGPIESPGWLARMAAREQAVRGPLVPASWVWRKVEKPYVGGDPINYLAYAREMRSFYQPHVREPVYLALTRAWLGATGGADIAVSLASVTGGVLLLLATYLLGRALGSPWAGLLAAAALAVDGEAIAWAPEGWRDSTAAAGMAFTMWAIVRLHQRRTRGWAIGVGVAAGLAALTRVTALMWLVPALAGLVFIAPREQRSLAAWRAGLAAFVAGVIVAPYLVNCAREFGDPFYALNYHTRYYRAAAGSTPNDAQTAAGFVTEQFRQRPVLATDTALRGLLVYPFENKWRGIERWMPGLGRALEALSITGLLVWLWQPMGRVLLVTLLVSLAPFMLTWRLGGGGEWRFTLHAYPFYLVAATGVVGLIWRTLRDRPSLTAARWRTLAVAGVATVLFAGGIALVLRRGPALVAAETLRLGDSVSVGGGEDDDVFFGAGWSDRTGAPPVVARFATAARAVVDVPLPERRAYRFVVRVDPLPPEVAAPGTLRLAIGGRTLAEWPLVWTPERVGSYVTEVPADLAGGGMTPVELSVSTPPAPLGEAAGRYQGLSGTLPVAFRFWMIRVTPGNVR